MPKIYEEKDSIKAKFMRSATEFRAATLTKKRMATTFRALAEMARKARWRDSNGRELDPSNLSQKQLAKFATNRLATGISVRAIHNELSHIRRALRGVGRAHFAEVECSNQALGIPQSCRKGKGKIVDPTVFSHAIAIAPADVRAWINGMCCLGLRQRELVRCGPSLPSWERQLISGQPVQLHDGSKGGRSRQICIPPPQRAEAIAAVRALRVLADAQKGRVVQSATLQAACHSVGARLAAVGLKGENAGHSLRRQFALNNYLYYRSEGFTKPQALSLLSNDLGHGDGRGTWVLNNYLLASLTENDA